MSMSNGVSFSSGSVSLLVRCVACVIVFPCWL